jgi:hypothetical protein
MSRDITLRCTLIVTSLIVTVRWMNICFYRSTNTDNARRAVFLANQVLWGESQAEQFQYFFFGRVSMHNGLELGNTDSQSVKLSWFLEQVYFYLEPGTFCLIGKGILRTNFCIQ